MSLSIMLVTVNSSAYDNYTSQRYVICFDINTFATLTFSRPDG